MYTQSMPDLCDIFQEQLDEISELLIEEIRNITGDFEYEPNDNGWKELFEITYSMYEYCDADGKGCNANVIHPILTAELLEQAINRTYKRLRG